MTTRVLLADDQALLRGTFRLLIDSAPDLTVVGETGDGAQTVAAVHDTEVDLVVMDIRMPGMDGIEATRQITADPELGHVRILVLTTFENEEMVAAALHAGASGFLGKGVTPQELLAAIRTVAAGEALLSPAATTALIARFRSGVGPELPRRAPLTGLDQLTAREREITVLVGAGLSNNEIAEHLTISPMTAKTHVNRSMMKVGARDRAQLVIFAYDHGLVTPRRPGES